MGFFLSFSCCHWDKTAAGVFWTTCQSLWQQPLSCCSIFCFLVFTFFRFSFLRVTHSYRSHPLCLWKKLIGQEKPSYFSLDSWKGFIKLLLQYIESYSNNSGSQCSLCCGNLVAGVCVCVCITLKCTGGCCHALLPASRRVFIHGHRRLFSLQLAEPSAPLKKSALGWQGTYPFTKLSFAPCPAPLSPAGIQTQTQRRSCSAGRRQINWRHYFIFATQVDMFSRLSVRCWSRARPPGLWRRD